MQTHKHFSLFSHFLSLRSSCITGESYIIYGKIFIGHLEFIGLAGTYLEVRRGGGG